MTDDEAAELGELLGLPHGSHNQGVQVPDSQDHYREYIARAEGGVLGAEKIAEPYWD